jgi:hypothetical protein
MLTGMGTSHEEVLSSHELLRILRQALTVPPSAHLMWQDFDPSQLWLLAEWLLSPSATSVRESIAGELARMIDAVAAGNVRERIVQRWVARHWERGPAGMGSTVFASLLLRAHVGRRRKHTQELGNVVSVSTILLQQPSDAISAYTPVPAV